VLFGDQYNRLRKGQVADATSDPIYLQPNKLNKQQTTLPSAPVWRCEPAVPELRRLIPFPLNILVCREVCEQLRHAGCKQRALAGPGLAAEVRRYARSEQVGGEALDHLATRVAIGLK